MSRPAISLSGVSKRYTKYEDTPTLAYSLLHVFGRSRRSQLWAVRDVELEVAQGEAIGVIGRNGSGKSTLLQMLCGVTAPTQGSVVVRGRIAPLISVGVGFHPELTGRENVYVNGTILGLTRREIDRRLDEIVAFSEIEDFVDTPVKFYSSGMYVRLGFSVAAHVQPDVLLIDEVLAVGDIGFQIKCFEHMNTLMAGGTTVVVVSHNLVAVQRLCTRGIHLAHGRMVANGTVDDAIASYYALLGAADDEAPQIDDVPVERGVLEVLDVRAATGRASRGRRADPIHATSVKSGDVVRVQVTVRAIQDVDAPFMSVAVMSEFGVMLYHEQNLFRPFPTLRAGEERTFETVLQPRLASGTYTLIAAVGRGTPGRVKPNRLGDDVAILMPPRRLLCYVTGRPGVGGLADLGAAFTGAATTPRTAR